MDYSDNSITAHSAGLFYELDKKCTMNALPAPAIEEKYVEIISEHRIVLKYKNILFRLLHPF